jgi:hypothetical protein
MTAQAALGGFKILKDVVRISVVSDGNSFPEELFRRIAEEKINLPYVTLVHEGPSWGLNIVAEAVEKEKICRLITEKYGKIFSVASRSAVLCFPPQKESRNQRTPL